MNPIYWPVWTIVLAGVGLGALIGIAVRVKMDKGLGGELVMPCGAGILVAALAVCIPMAIRADNQYRVWCAAQGGHVDTHTDTQTVSTVSGNGQVGVGTSSSVTYYCLTNDGRIIDVS